jgi:hypothetical protein
MLNDREDEVMVSFCRISKVLGKMAIPFPEGNHRAAAILLTVS